MRGSKIGTLLCRRGNLSLVVILQGFGIALLWVTLARRGSVAPPLLTLSRREDANQHARSSLGALSESVSSAKLYSSPLGVTQNPPLAIDIGPDPTNNTSNGPVSSIVVGSPDCPGKRLGLKWMDEFHEDNGPCGRQELQAYRNRTDFHFVGLGVQKGGTTTLFQRIASHPMSFIGIKEMKFFLDSSVDKMSPSKAKKQFFVKHWWSVEEVDQGMRRGEITPEYQAQPSAALRVHNVLGGPLRFIVMLREPIARAYSFYQMQRRLGNPKKKIKETFELTIEKEYLLLQECIAIAREGKSEPSEAGTGAKEVEAGVEGVEGKRALKGKEGRKGEGGGGRGTEESVMGMRNTLGDEFQMQWEGVEDLNWYRDCYLPRYRDEGSAKPGSGTVGPLGYGFYFIHLYHWFQVHPPCSFMILEQNELNIPGTDQCLWRFLDAHPFNFTVPGEQKNFAGKDGEWMQVHIYEEEDPINKKTVTMLKKMYSPFVKRLEKLVGRKFTSWGY